jgi:uncharacterized protein YecT (DUF1311 family)
MLRKFGLQKFVWRQLMMVLGATTIGLAMGGNVAVLAKPTVLAALKPGVMEPYCRDRGQTDVNRCAATWFATADFMQQSVIERYTNGLGPIAAAEFATVQQGWTVMRDQHCALAALPIAGGALYPSVYEGCRARLTNDRMADLQQWAPDQQRSDVLVFQLLEGNEQKLVRQLKPGTPQLTRYLAVATLWEQYRMAHCKLEAGRTDLARPNVGLSRLVSCENRLAQGRSAQLEGLLGLGW